MKWKKLTSNPAQYVKLPSAKEAENVYALDEQEIDRLLQCAQQMDLYPLFRMALLLGMREGEFIGLKWADIDFEKTLLKVQRSVSYRPNPATGKYEYIVGPPKTKKGIRSIHLPHDIVALLREHREKQKQIQATAARWAHLDLVFCTRYGTYIDATELRRRFERLLKAAGLAPMKFHALRHNASLILRRLGIDPVVRKEILLGIAVWI